jgi:hypothetical protein
MIIAHDLSPVGILLHAGRDRRWFQAIAGRLERSLKRPVVLRILVKTGPTLSLERLDRLTRGITQTRLAIAPSRSVRLLLNALFARLITQIDAALRRFVVNHQLVQERRARTGRASGSPTHDFSECHFSQRTVP